jgi:hypothetical protein
MRGAHVVTVSTTVLVLVLLPAGSVAAQSVKQTNEKQAFQEELARLRKAEPAEFDKARRVFTLATELLLARLGYGIGPFDGVLDPKTAEALRAYEKARRIPVTGDPLSFETVEAVRRDTAALDENAPSLPPRHVFTDLWDSGYVSASGTWTIVGEEMGMPRQTSKINCDRKVGVCTEATAILTFHDGEPSLSVDIDTYEIERWDQHEVVTKPLQFGCTRYVRRITRLQKAVSGIRSTTSIGDECKGIDQGEKYLVLADGFEVYWRLREAQRAKWRDLMLVTPELLKDLGGPKKQRK